MYNEDVNNKLYTFFKTEMGMIDYTRGWLKGECPNCGKYKLGINIQDGRVNCFVCGYLGNPMRFIANQKNIVSLREVYKLLNIYGGIMPQQRKYLKAVGSKIKLPESFRLLSLGDSEMAKLARNYIKLRGLSVKGSTYAGVGYCTKGRYMGCIIFPFYQAGKLIYFMARRFISLGEKILNPPEGEFGVSKSQVIYNIDALLLYNKINIVESVFNARTLGNNTCATLGKKLSSWQLNQFIISPVKYISILLDPDAYSEAIELGLRLTSANKVVKVVKLPEGGDVNTLGSVESRKLEKSQPWLNYHDVLRLKWQK